MDDVNLVAVPFNLSSVQLKQGSKFDVMRTANRLFLLNLNSSSLMCLYSSAANLTGSWAHPDGCVPYSHPGYWGHYLGHYLSATALLIASNTSATGDVELLGKTQAMVSYLGQVQDAWTQLGPAYDGFLFPYDRYTFDTLFGVYGPVQYCAPVCVPFYIFHKVMAGMLDQYTLAGNAQALTIAINMARWARTNIEAVIARGGQQLWQAVLNVEWGGMNDALFNLYRITGDPDHLATAERFNHFIWTAPLAAGQDNLGGFHANTHIPEVIGDVNGYEITSNATKLAIGECAAQKRGVHGSTGRGAVNRPLSTQNRRSGPPHSPFSACCRPRRRCRHDLLPRAAGGPCVRHGWQQRPRDVVARLVAGLADVSARAMRGPTKLGKISLRPSFVVFQVQRSLPLSHRHHHLFRPRYAAMTPPRSPARSTTC